MKLVMTLMVRDEADIVETMLEHHLAQGVDHFIVTDNGSVDGTTDILGRFVARGVMDLRSDPVHRKQQGSTVTGMARDAFTLHGATWVLNADADEFWVPVNRELTLRDCFERIPVEFAAFPVPVIDMIGLPADSGPGLRRLRYRDLRPVAALRSVGLFAHSSPDVAHVGRADVEVVQGNHFVNIESAGIPDPALSIEVLHLQWRSWAQFERKVGNAGRAYESSTLTPSPNHHGMRDWRRLREGTLRSMYIARHPSTSEINAGMDDGSLVGDTTLTHLAGASDGRGLGDDETAESRAVAAVILSREAQIQELQDEIATGRSRELDVLLELEATRGKVADLSARLALQQNRKVVRMADRLARLARIDPLRPPTDTQV